MFNHKKIKSPFGKRTLSDFLIIKGRNDVGQLQAAVIISEITSNFQSEKMEILRISLKDFQDFN